METGLFCIILLIVCTDIFDAISQLFLKLAINHQEVEINGIKKVIIFFFKLMKMPRMWVSAFFSTLSLSVWLFVLSKAELSFAYSVDSMRYIFVTLVSLFFLKERIGLLRWLGIASIVFGIIMVTLK